MSRHLREPIFVSSFRWLAFRASAIANVGKMLPNFIFESYRIREREEGFMASVFKRGRWVKERGQKCTKDTPGAKWAESRFWTVQISINGRPKLVKGYTDRSASEQLGARMEKAKARGEEGLLDIYKAHRGLPLQKHVDDYIGDLEVLGRDDKYIYNVKKRLAKLMKLCSWKLLRDITADEFCKWREKPIEQCMAESDNKRIGPRTLNQYLETARTFCKWAVKRKRIASNPLQYIEKMDETADVRRSRRALTEEQIANLLTEVSGHHKAVYRFMLGTGLRRQEVADLQWGDVRLNATTPFLKLRPKATKSRRGDSLPLRADMADELRRLRGEAGDGENVFGAVPSIEEHKAYLRAAGIAWKDSNGRRADIHALRHTYGSMLSKSGASPREAMELMRHTDLKLTMKVYTDPRIFDLAGAVDRLPIPGHDVEQAAATGTLGIKDSAAGGFGRSESVSSPSTQNGPATAGIVKAIERDKLSQVHAGGRYRQQKTLSGKDRVKVRHVGLEPTTR
jgi:integrase